MLLCKFSGILECSVVGARLVVSVVERALLADHCCMCMLQANTSGYQVIFYGTGPALIFSLHMLSVTNV